MHFEPPSLVNADHARCIQSTQTLHEQFDWAAPDPSLQTWDASPAKSNHIAEWLDHGSNVSATQSSVTNRADDQCFVVDGRWKTGPLLGAGSFGDVFEAEHLSTGEKVAVKLESTSSFSPTLETEYQVLSELSEMHGKMVGLPKLLYYGKQSARDYVLVMQKLGASLEYLRNKQERNCLSLKSVLAIGIQAIGCLERLHDAGFVHCDVKPENMLVGDKDPSQIYLVDFGLAQKYVDECGNHFPERSYEGLVGTLTYASVTAHSGTQPSRRCDLESLGYSLVEMFQGSLPWFVDDSCPIGRRLRRKRVGEQKRRIDAKKLCKGMGEAFENYFTYVRDLEYTERPDYDMLRALLRAEMRQRGLRNDGSFEWCSKNGWRKWCFGLGGLLLTLGIASVFTRRDDAKNHNK